MYQIDSAIRNTLLEHPKINYVTMNYMTYMRLRDRGDIELTPSEKMNASLKGYPVKIAETVEDATVRFYVNANTWTEVII